MSPELERDVLVCALEGAKTFHRTYFSRLSDEMGMAASPEYPPFKAEHAEWAARIERLKAAIAALDASMLGSNKTPLCPRCGGDLWLPDPMGGVTAVFTPDGPAYCHRCKE